MALRIISHGWWCDLQGGIQVCNTFHGGEKSQNVYASVIFFFAGFNVVTHLAGLQGGRLSYILGSEWKFPSCWHRQV